MAAAAAGLLETMADPESQLPGGSSSQPRNRRVLAAKLDQTLLPEGPAVFQGSGSDAVSNLSLSRSDLD